MSEFQNRGIRILQFKQTLSFLKANGRVKSLHRGIDKKFAFQLYNLDTEYNTIEQFGEQLFYFGEKAKYFWQARFGDGITLNDVSHRVFKYIFQCFHGIANANHLKLGTIQYKKRNKAAFAFFAVVENLPKFLSIIRSFESETRRRYRNYYLRIIHQLGETDYNHRSLHVSSSENSFVARRFSRGQILINFWDFDFNHFNSERNDIPVFIGKPYYNQREISVFSAIFPHHIYSFEFEGHEYFNPALFGKESTYSMIMNGFTINQGDFNRRLRETIYHKGVQQLGFTYKEISTKRRTAYGK